MIELSNLNEINDKEFDFNNIDSIKKVNCEILRSGLGPLETSYYYCNCDPAMKDPICEECMRTCHRDHQFTKKEFLNGVCSCGMKSHIVKKESDIADTNYLPKCFFSEISEITKLNVYYSSQSSDNLKDAISTICMFCHNFCKNERILKKNEKNYNQKLGENNAKKTGKKENYQNLLNTSKTKNFMDIENFQNRDKKENSKFIRNQLPRTNKRIPVCECKHRNHKNLENILKVLNSISAESFDRLEFEDLTYTHFINTILNSDKTFENLYINFTNGMESIKFSIKDEKYQFEDIMDTTCGFYMNLENLAKIVIHKKNYHYLTHKLNDYLGDNYIFHKIIEKKFDFKQNSIWKIKANYLSVYLACKFKQEINPFPNLKISNIKLLNPFQRLLIVHDMRLLKSENLNLLELSLNMIHKINREKEKLPESYNILSKFYLICKLFTKCSFFSNDQLIKFCKLNDEVIQNFSEARQQFSENRGKKIEVINHQFKILSHIVKCLTYLIYHYNDQYVYTYLKGESKLDEIKFYTNSELIKKISKNAIKIMTALRIYKQLETSFEKDEILEKIISQATDIVSMSTITNEEYYSGMKKLLNSNADIYLKLLNSNFEYKDMNILEFLKDNTRILEMSYFNYFNSKISYVQLCDAVKQSVNEFFFRINLKNFDYSAYLQKMDPFKPFSNGKENNLNQNQFKISYNFFTEINYNSYNSNYNLNETKFHNDKNEYSSAGELNQNNSQDPGKIFKYQILLNKNFYIYSLIKIIKIFAEENLNHNNQVSKYLIEESLFELVTKILTFYIQDNSDNCRIFFTSDFTEMIRMLNGEQQIQMLELFRIGLKILEKDKIEISSCDSILDMLENIIKKITHKTEIVKLVEKILLIVYTLIKIPFIKKDKLIEKIRSIIKNLYLNNFLLVEYKNFLIEGNNGTTPVSGIALNNQIEDDKFNNQRKENRFTSMLQKKQDSYFLINKKFDASFYKVSESLINHDLNYDYVIEIFTKFLKIVNSIFNGDSILEESILLHEIFRIEEIPGILKRKDLNIKLRTEILKFVRITNFDVLIQKGKLYFYRSLILSSRKYSMGDFDSNQNFGEDNILINETSKLYQDLININHNFEIPKNQSEFEFAILKFELKNFVEIWKYNQFEKIEKIKNYIENGLAPTLSVHINKVFSFYNNLNVEEILKFYEIIFLFLKMKEYILENLDFAKILEKNKNFTKNPFIDEFSIPNKNSLVLRTNYIFINKEKFLEEVRMDLELVSSTNFEIFKSTSLFNQYKKHFHKFFSFEELKSKKTFLKIFSKKDFCFSPNKIKKMQEALTNDKKIKSEIDKKIFELLIKYANDKNKIEDNKFIENLDELNSHYYLKYRQQHIRNLLFVYNETKFSPVLKREVIWNIFRLLQYDTIPTQKCFMELFEKKSDLLNFSDLTDNFFKHLLCVLFNELNPFKHSEYYDYYTAISIIKIFKYLCEEHNQIFQRIFFQEVTLDYIPLYGMVETDKNDRIISNKNSSQRLNEILKKRDDLSFIKESSKENEKEIYFKSEAITSEEKNNSREKKISFMFNVNKNNKIITLFDFMLTILGKIILMSKWEEVNVLNDYGNANSISFFYDIFFVIIEFLIEMIQGTEGDNLKKIIKDYSNDDSDAEEDSKHFSEFLIRIKPLLFKHKNNSEILYRIKNDLIDFLMAFIEEKSTPTKLVTFMSTIIHPNSMMEAIVHVMKKLFIKENLHKNLISEISFDHHVYSFLSTIYFNKPEFSENPEFVLANRMYHYIKQLGTNEKFLHDDAKFILNSIKNISKTKAKSELQNRKRDRKFSDGVSQTNFDEALYENFYCVKFFEKIIRTVFVQLESGGVSSSQNKPVQVIFTLNPLIRYLSNHTRIDFYDKVDRNSRYIKLYSLMTQCDQFFYEVKYYSERANKNKLLKFLNRINYFWLEAFVFFITVVINLFMIAVLGKNENVHGNETYTPIINILSYINISLNFLFICIWFYSKFKLYYMIERNYILMRYKTEKVSYRLFFKIIYNAILNKPEVYGFLANIIIGSIGVSKPNYNFAYSLQLLAIINLSETLKNIFRSIVSKYRQLTATMAFVFLLCYIFASIAFFYFSEDFIHNIFDPNHPETPKYGENQCSSLVLCFLTHVDYGLRTDGGIGEYMNKRRSFIIDPFYYTIRFIYEDIFFIMIIVILLSLLFGIIIDAFAELRDKYLKYEKDKKDNCFICGATREQLEKKCENFDRHVAHVHNMWTYVDYIIGLKFIDLQETNAINSYVIEQVNKKQIAWLPVEEEDAHFIEKQKVSE